MATALDFSKVDISQLPDKGEKQLDFSGVDISALPDKEKVLDFSQVNPAVLPDQPQATQVVEESQSEESFARNVIGETLKEAGRQTVGGTEALLATIGGMVDFLNPIPGIVGIEESIRNKSVEQGAQSIERSKAAFSPFLIYQPQTKHGAEALEGVNKFLDWLIGRPARVIGETAQAVVEPIAGETAGAIAGTVGQVGTELAAFAMLGAFAKAPLVKQKVIRGEPLTKAERVEMEQSLVEVHQGLKEGKLTGEIINKEAPSPHFVFDETASLSGRQFETIFEKPIVETPVPKVLPGAKVMDLIKRRRADLDIGKLESEAKVIQLEQKLPTAELEAMPFIIQEGMKGVKDTGFLSKIGREDLAPIVKNPSKALLKEAREVGKYFDEGFDFLKQEYSELNYVDRYVTQLWDIPKDTKSNVINFYSKNNPFTKKRKIPSYKEGIERGWVPKTTNIAEILRVYDAYKINSVHNSKFARALSDLTTEDGIKLIQRFDKAPEDWVAVDHPALNRAIAIGKVGEEGILLRKAPVKVHPEIVKEVNIIFDKPFSHQAIQALETVNAFAKKGMLSFSFFHHFALTESAFSAGIGRKAMSLWNPYKVYNAIKKKDFEIFRRQPAAKDSIDHGVSYGALADVQRSRVQNALFWAERSLKNVPGFGKLAKGVRKGNQLWDAGLWDYYHNTLKLFAYEENVMQGLKWAEKRTQRLEGRSLNAAEIEAIKKDIGNWTNDAFGGQNWEFSRIFGNPKMRQMAQWLLLAPDWTASTIKQAIAPIRGLVKTARAKGPTEALQGKVLARRGAIFWMRAALYYNLVAQSVNYYTTKRDFGEGRFTWQNDPGQELNVYFKTNKDGSKLHFRPGKQFRDVFEMVIDPIGKFGRKMSPALREFVTQISKHDPGSGFPSEFAEMEFFESLPARLKSIVQVPLPFSLRPFIKDRPAPFLFSLPVSKGMTSGKAIRFFVKAMEKGDAKELKRIYISALENNLNAKGLLTTAKSQFKSDLSYDDRELARDIFEELQSVSSQQAWMDLLGVYKQKGILTPAVWGWVRKLIAEDIEIKRQQEAFGIRNQ